jgi:peptidoglycan/xylan/chitin deacetylase (PgdA/CDA1 family)
VAVLLFHKLTTRPELGISWHTPQQFEKIIRRLHEAGFYNGRSREWADNPSDPKKLLITFDDGYDGIFEYALPILKKYGFTALVFLVAAYLGKKSFWDMNILQRFRHLDWDEILELKQAGFEFGSHTMSHPDLTFVSPKRLEWELKESKKTLEERLGTIDCLSYPFGRYNNEVKEAAKRAGYRLGFAIHLRQNDCRFNPLTVKRIPAHFIDPWWLLKAELLRPDSWLGQFGQAQGKLINFLSRGTTLMKKKEYKNDFG